MDYSDSDYDVDTYWYTFKNFCFSFTKWINKMMVLNIHKCQSCANKKFNDLIKDEELMLYVFGETGLLESNLEKLSRFLNDECNMKISNMIEN